MESNISRVIASAINYQTHVFTQSTVKMMRGAEETAKARERQ